MNAKKGVADSRSLVGGVSIDLFFSSVVRVSLYRGEERLYTTVAVARSRFSRCL